MSDHLNEEELKQVTGGLISYANDSGDNTKPIDVLTNAIIQAECADCHMRFTGPARIVQRNVDFHLQSSGHSYCRYTETNRHP